MYRKTSKTRRRAELALIYTIMATAVVALVAILILVMQGYRYNKFDGKIEQGGLLQYDSQPSGGTVAIDGAKLGNQTPNKITTTAGNHTVTMTKDGYIDWKKNITVRAGGILWLNYTRFIPKTRTVQPVADLASLSGAKLSRDKKYAVIKEAPELPELTLVNLDSETPKKETIPLDAAHYEKAVDQASVRFELGDWDRDNRYVLVKYSYDDKYQWLVVDTRSKKIVNNVTAELGVEVKSLQFVYASARQLYVLTTANEVRRIDLDGRSITGPLLENVADFEQYKDTLLSFATLPDSATGKRLVGYLTSGAKAPRIVRSFADNGSPATLMHVGRYYNETYTTIANGDSLEIMKGDLPASDSPSALALKTFATLPVPGGVKYLGFSPDENRHVYAQNDNQIVTYDLELQTASTTPFASPQPQAVRWVDRYHFVNNDGARIMLYEFDGKNPTELTATSVAGMPADFSPNNKYFYLFSTPNGVSALSRIKIVIQ